LFLFLIDIAIISLIAAAWLSWMRRGRAKSSAKPFRHPMAQDVGITRPPVREGFSARAFSVYAVEHSHDPSSADF